MIQRLIVLVSYFLRRLFFSLAGIIYIILTLTYWVLLFPPGQGTPDAEYYVLIIGAFGPGLTFLTVLTVAARANRAGNYPFVVRLHSRVEYLTAVLLSSICFATFLQLLLGLLALIQGPHLSLGRVLEIPPIWLAANILAAVLAVHATDFVTSNWSRVYVYGILAILLLGQSGSGTASRWLASRVNGLSRALMNSGRFDLAAALSNLAAWITDQGARWAGQAFGVVFWPFRAVAEAVVDGYFNPAQALAPAILLLYATILFMLAAELFATKDLDFAE